MVISAQHYAYARINHFGKGGSRDLCLMAFDDQDPDVFKGILARIVQSLLIASASFLMESVAGVWIQTVRLGMFKVLSIGYNSLVWH